MGDEVGLVCLGEGAEAGDQRGGGQIRDSSEVEIEVVEGWQEVGGVYAGGHGILEVVVFAVVGVSQVADVAVEGAVAEGGLEAVPLGCVVVHGAGHDGWVVSFDGGLDAFGVGRVRGVDKSVELLIGLHGAGNEDFGFIGYMGEN